ncbi:MAG: hypothetical protein MUF80_06385 [Burkholderiales bacterium]|jgi:hypothetical protein|nr:hypothetical protein [Burkholderiales bacterium]
MSDIESIPLKPALITDVHTVSSRERMRNELAADVEAFLRRGGAIEAIVHEQRTDLRRPPTVGYDRDVL